MAVKVFPVIYSTLSPEGMKTQVLSQYSIGEVKSCEFWHKGLSDIYLVETVKGLYILRVSHHHWRCKSEIEFELELLDFLHQQNLPVAYPLSTKQGELYQEIEAPEGKRYAALFIYAQGQIPIGDLNISQSRKLGSILAKLHQIGGEFGTDALRKPLSLEYLLDESLQAIAPFLYYRSEDLDYLLEVIGEIKDKIGDLPKISPLWTICWGDPHSGNVHFTPEEEMTLFDFDQCGYGWRSFDIGKFLHIALGTGISRYIREALLEGYQAMAPLSQKELNCLQAFTETAHIWTWAISINTAKVSNYSRLDPCYFTMRLQQLKRLKSRDWQLF